MRHKCRTTPAATNFFPYCTIFVYQRTSNHWMGGFEDVTIMNLKNHDKNKLYYEKQYKVKGWG